MPDLRRRSRLLVTAGATVLARALGARRAGPSTSLAADVATSAQIEILANMSHELRTPLNAVLGFADLLRSEPHGPLGDPRYADYARHIRAGGDELLAVVDAATDLAQLVAGRLALQPQPVDPGSLVNECACSLSALARAAGVELKVEPSTAPQINADPLRLKQVLVNLLSNAIKFTPKGGRVTIWATCHDDAVSFEVADNGVGMTPEQVRLALQPFQVLEPTLTRRHRGLGMGLPLAEGLVRLQGGELRIASEPGRGTAVTATVPRGGRPGGGASWR